MTHPELSAEETDARRELVDANHILFDQGVVDGFGHVSVRHPTKRDRFILARSMAPALVSEADLQLLDFDGHVIEGDPRPPYLERFIHGEIYRRHDDVNSVVHSHSPAIIPFGVVASARLRPVCHMSGFLHPASPVFEIRDTGGMSTDMLVRNSELGAALADTRGTHAVILMRGHGSTTVGGTLRQAVFRAVYAEVNARLQAAAMALGPVTYLSADEALLSTKANDGQIHRAWELWRMAVKQSADPSPGIDDGTITK